MKIFALLFLSTLSLFAQTGLQAVYFIQSPSNPAFASLNPQPDFEASVSILFKTTTSPQRIEINIGFSDTAKNMSFTNTFATAGWQTMNITLPANQNPTSINVVVLVPGETSSAVKAQ